MRSRIAVAALGSLNRHSEAVQSHDRAIRFSPNDAAIHNNRGHALIGLRRHAEAILSFDQAILLDPAIGVAHRNRALPLLHLKQYNEALIAFGEAITLDPNDQVSFEHQQHLLQRGVEETSQPETE